MPDTFDTSKGFRIKSVANLTGLSSHTIRKWEERYQLLTPVRSDNGYRLYFEDDLQLLMYIKSQIASGRTIGQMAKIGPDRLRHDMQEGPVRIMGLPTVHDNKASMLVQAARRLDRNQTENLIQNLVDRLGLEQSIQQIFFPVLKVIGELWHRGQISITGEHMVSQTIRRHLVEALPKRNVSKGQSVVVACAPQDFHEIGAMAATLILRNSGWQPIYLGTDSGIDMIRLACKRRLAKLIIISMVREPSKKEFTKMMNQLTKRLLPLCPIIVGGQGASGFKSKMEQSGITYLPEIGQIKSLKPQISDYLYHTYGVPSLWTKETMI